MKWNDKQPIYQQIRDKIADAILDGSLTENEAIPSIRQLSSDYHINPLTVSKAYQMLTDEKLITKRRGMGMYVKANAKQTLLKKERQQFIKEELPQLKEKIQRLGFTLAELLK